MTAARPTTGAADRVRTTARRWISSLRATAILDLLECQGFDIEVFSLLRQGNAFPETELDPFVYVIEQGWSEAGNAGKKVIRENFLLKKLQSKFHYVPNRIGLNGQFFSLPSIPIVAVNVYRNGGPIDTQTIIY